MVALDRAEKSHCSHVQRIWHLRHVWVTDSVTCALGQWKCGCSSFRLEPDLATSYGKVSILHKKLFKTDKRQSEWERWQDKATFWLRNGISAMGLYLSTCWSWYAWNEPGVITTVALGRKTHKTLSTFLLQRVLSPDPFDPFSQCPLSCKPFDHTTLKPILSISLRSGHSKTMMIFLCTFFQILGLAEIFFFSLYELSQDSETFLQSIPPICRHCLQYFFFAANKRQKTINLPQAVTLKNFPWKMCLGH